MRKNVAMAFMLVVLVAVVSCAPLRPGADSFLTRSEQSLDIAFWSVDSLFRVEKITPEIDKLVPGSHAAIDKMRRDAPAVFTAAMDALDAYRQSPDKGTASQARVTQAIAVAQSLANDATAWLTKINAAKGGK